MGGVGHLLFGLLMVLFAATVVRSDDDCAYTAYVRTGSTINAGTGSVISLTLCDATGEGFRIPDMVAWGGLLDPGDKYFQRGNLDIFSGRGRCLRGPVCRMNLTSDGSGTHHGWYCNYVEVTSTGPHVPCAQQLFTVEQWLALDTSPYNLTALRDCCRSDGGHRILESCDGAYASVW